MLDSSPQGPSSNTPGISPGSSSGSSSGFSPRTARLRTTRLAPTPSGALHVGNARTFILNWALARSQGWRIVLRLEDLDIGRVKEGALDASIADLRGLGLDWDGEPEVQSRDLGVYRAALDALAARGDVFRCDRSRSEIRSAASAPHDDDGETRYPPELRPREPWPRTIDAWEANHRLRIDPAIERVRDELRGDRVFNPGLEAGDLVVWTRLGVPAYQLAVVVDDARHGVTDVVRGDDLLASAARQQWIARALALPHAAWWHLPLVYGEDGKRLAKRHGSHSLRELFAAGVSAERIAGWCAWSIGLLERREPISLPELATIATPERLRAAIAAGDARDQGPRTIFIAEDLAWLHGAC
jgi:glutamyl-tRNA synthetase